MRRALAYGTALPVAPTDRSGQAALLGWPLVGLLVGLLWVVVGRAGSLFLGPAVGAGLVLLADAWFTRARHLDGLAALVDGVSASDDPDEVVEVVREPALRATGAAVLLGLALVRFGVLVQVVLPPGELAFGVVPGATLVLVAPPIAGRLAAVAAWWRAPLRHDEPDAPGVPQPSVGTLVLVAGLAGLLAAAGALAALDPLGVGLAVVAVGLGVGAGLAAWWQQRAGDLVDEVPAAACLVAETLVLLLVARLLTS